MEHILKRFREKQIVIFLEDIENFLAGYQNRIFGVRRKLWECLFGWKGIQFWETKQMLQISTKRFYDMDVKTSLYVS